MSNKILLTGNFFGEYAKELNSKGSFNIAQWKYAPTSDYRFELAPIDQEVVGIIVFHPLLSLVDLCSLEPYRKNWNNVMEQYNRCDRKPWVYVLSGFKGIYDKEVDDMEVCYMFSDYVPFLLNTVAKYVATKVNMGMVTSYRGVDFDSLSILSAETKRSRSFIESVQIINAKLTDVIGKNIVINIVEENMDGVIDRIMGCFAFTGYKCGLVDGLLTLSW